MAKAPRIPATISARLFPADLDSLDELRLAMEKYGRGTKISIADVISRLLSLYRAGRSHGWLNKDGSIAEKQLSEVED